MILTPSPETPRVNRLLLPRQQSQVHNEERRKVREREMLNVTGDHVTWADSPYIVTLKAFDKRAGVVQAGNKLEEENNVEKGGTKINNYLTF